MDGNSTKIGEVPEINVTVPRGLPSPHFRVPELVELVLAGLCNTIPFITLFEANMRGLGNDFETV